MKKVLLFSALVYLFLIPGCASTPAKDKWIQAPCIPVITSSGSLKNYTLGERKTAFIGQEIIKVLICDDIQKKAILRRDNIIKEQYAWQEFNLKKGSIKSIFCTVEYDGKTYNVTNDFIKNRPMRALNKAINIINVTKDPVTNMPWGLLISEDGNINQNGLYNHEQEYLYFLDSVVINPDKVEYINSCVRTNPTSMSYELIFTGKNDVSLNTTYKEYTSDDFARPAFFQNLTYQENAKQIRFKNFLIQIHNVTNEQITYTILEDGLK